MLLLDGIRRGSVRPLSRIVFGPTEASRAFRLLAASRHRGRVLLHLQGTTKDIITLQSEPRIHCTPDACHLIICNNNNLSLRIAERLTMRGATKIYLHGISKSGYTDFEIGRSLQKHGAEIILSNDTLKSEGDITKLLTNCNNIGNVEGVYLITTDDVTQRSFNIIQELDTATRNLCPHLRYFGIITGIADYGINTCISRVQDKLPATLIKLPADNKMSLNSTSSEEAIREANILDIFELALRSNEPVIILYTRSDHSKSLLEEIASLAAIEVPEDVDVEVSLSELNFECDKSLIISTFLRDAHNISVAENEVPNFTIQKIREMEATMTDPGFKERKGLESFYSYIDPDELLATTEMVFLPTQANSSAMRDDEFDVNQTYLCVIPGLEGHHQRFSTLSERLKLPSIILQPGLDRPDETISSLAQRYAAILLKKTELKRNFYLMGYESGTLVALEMAAILEDHGLTGTVFCIGSPDQFQVTLKEQLREYNNAEALQLAVARHMFNLMVGGNTDALEKALSGADTWREKIEASVRSILGRVSHSAQYARELIECAYGRIKQVQDYTPTVRALRSKLIVLRTLSEVNNDQSLQFYSQQPITVYELRAPLTHAAADLRCSAIINRHLDSELLEAFEQKNLCDTYLLNADTFMTMDPSYAPHYE